MASIEQDGFRNSWRKGQTAFFEYHCNQSHSSAHAEWWYRSQQLVTVLCISERGIGRTLAKRNENCCSRIYRIRWADGFEGDVFEDELLIDPKFYDTASFTPGVRP